MGVGDVFEETFVELGVFLEAFLEHSHACEHIFIFLKLDSIFLFGEFAPVVFNHLSFEIFKRHFLGSEER